MSATARRLIVAGAAVTVLCTTTASRAEVRLRPAHGQNRATLDVHLTSAGPWTARGLESPATLNPSGDLTGDGFPGHAQLSSGIVVAWLSPSDGQLRRAQANDSAWTHLPSVPAPNAVGTPRVIAVGGSGLIVWGSLDPAAHVECMSVDGNSAHVVPVSDGYLVGTIALPNRVHVIAWSPGDDLVTVTTMGLLPTLPTFPDPMLRAVIPLGIRAPAPASTASLFPSVPSQPGIIYAAPAIHEGETRDGKYALVTWWTDPQHLQFVELDEDGPVLPVETLEANGRAEYSPSLLNEAIRTVRER